MQSQERICTENDEVNFYCSKKCMKGSDENEK